MGTHLFGGRVPLRIILVGAVREPPLPRKRTAPPSRQAAYKLQVSEVFTIGAWGAENLQTGDWDLSLFTCTPSGKNRVLVRCTLVDPAQLTQADA